MTDNNKQQKPQFSGSYVSRADLLRFLQEGDQHLEKMAEFSGYHRLEQKKTIRKPQPRIGSSLQEETPEVDDNNKTEEAIFVEPKQGTRFWQVTQCQMKEAPPTTDEKPGWTKGKGFTDRDEMGTDYSKIPPAVPPLVPWSQLWPFLKNSLTIEYEKSIDIARLIRKISKLQPVYKIPKKKSQTWANHCQIIFDHSERLVPFWDDMFFLYKKLTKLRGESGLQAFCIDGNPHAKFWIYAKPYEPATEFVIPENPAPMLIVSDLGCFEKSPSLTKSWLRFGKNLNRHNIFPTVLTPCPPKQWNRQLLKYFRLCWWDRGQKLPRHQTASQCYRVSNFELQQSVSDLLALLSPAIRIEPALLRAVRLSLPASNFDSGVEAAVWNHQDVRPCPIAFVYGKDAIEEYRGKFLQQNKQLREQVFTLVQEYHQHFAESVRYEEELAYYNLQGQSAAQAQKFIEKIFRTIDSSNYHQQQALKHWLCRLVERQHKDMWKNPVLTACWFKIHLEEWKQDRITLKKGMNYADIVWMIHCDQKTSQYNLLQTGNHLRVTQNNIIAMQSFAMGSLLTSFSTSRPGLEVFQIVQDVDKIDFVNIEKDSNVPIPKEGHLIISSDCQKITVEPIEKPHWAQSIGRNREGLFLTVAEKICDKKIWWFNPGLYQSPEGDKSIFKSEGFWGNATGVDQYGLYLDLSVKGIEFRMRWIEPGTFMMGSPEDEPDRENNEVLHEVTLTEGFWLADTACTQELWRVVMGSDPSRFKGDKKPVDSVNWDNCADFLQYLNDLIGLGFRFPTEAEWEYACRAGTKTAYSFGNSINEKQVNYSKGETVEVKSLPCNNWGLYQMHGNVWEWCSDYYGDYPSDAVTDPTGPNSGSERVLRGGCWFNSARDARSACRPGSAPDYDWYSLGFRFALGQKKQASRRSADEVQRSKPSSTTEEDLV